MAGHEMDYSQITDEIFIGSDLCKGLSCPIHTREFERLGICGEINLEIEHAELPPKNIDAYLWLPVVDRQSPTLDQFLIGTSALAEMVKLKNKIYVHCKNGHGRSPTLVAAYLMRYKGMDMDGAIKFIKEKRPEIHIEEAQKKALEEFAKQWK